MIWNIKINKKILRVTKKGRRVGDSMKNLLVDCFAGGGGASVGIEMSLGRQVNIAINHDPDAILMHKTNHPDTLHIQEDIFEVDILKYTKGEHVALMWASPDCTSHSKAKGGKPRKSGLRILPWAVYKHAKAILPDVIFMENVEEIQDWGPLDEQGYPIKERKGEDYRKFINAMISLGYVFECRELIAADYGVPTTRKRWYAIFRKDRKPIVWPTPTHSKTGANGLPKWIAVSTCLDFSNLGKSIFGRKKPLAENTMNRIARGIDKFVLNNPEPFIMQIGQTGFTKDRNKTIHEPLSTIVTKNEHCLITPTIIQYHSETTRNGVRGQSLTDPIMTIDTSPRYALASTFLTKFYKTGIGQSVDEPIHTITTSPGHFGQVIILKAEKEDFLANIDLTLKDQYMKNEIIKKCNLVANFIIEYYGQGTAQPVNEPLHTIVTKDRFALVTIYGIDYVIYDITLRMLTAKELFKAQGFPDDYIIDKDFNGKPYPISKQVARCGNSVVPMMAKALVDANCSYLKTGERMPNTMIDDSERQLKFA